MKRLIFYAAGCVALMAGCKEKDAPIIFTQSADSSFTVSPVPATDAHNVLVEEFTGQGCSNCPAAHDQLEAIASQNSGRVNIIGMYVYNIPQSNPPGGSKNDFRDSVAYSIGQAAYSGVGSLPSGGVDRIVSGGKILLDAGVWGGLITSQLNVPDPLNLKVSSSYNVTTGEAQITATVIYTQQVSVPQNISVVVVEDSIIDIQEYPVFHPVYPSGYDSNYVFTNVFRGMVSSPPFGDPILAKVPVKEPGQGYEIHYTYKPKDIMAPGYAIVPKHCRVIAFVNTNNGTDYHIVQSAQCPLIP